MFEIAETEVERKLGAKITVIGVGGAGCNAVNTMIESGLDGVSYIVANTDAQALEVSLAETKIQMGVEITKGLGAGANPEIGKKAAMEDFERITETLEDSDLVFITAGMGGGTGTGAAPVISKLAKDLGALTVGVVTKPFAFEGRKRMRQAVSGIDDLKPNVDSLIIIPNEKLLEVAGESLSLIETFKEADEVLLNAVKGIADLINNTGLINSDFADVATIMGNKGTAIMGTGYATGEDRALNAAKEAINSPLLEDAKIDGATGIIVNITGSKGITTFEANQAMKFIMEEADEDAEVIFGTVIDPDIGDEVKVTVIATGLNQVESLEGRRLLRKQEVKTESIEDTFNNYQAPSVEKVQETTMSEPIINEVHHTPYVETIVQASEEVSPEVIEAKNFVEPTPIITHDATKYHEVAEEVTTHEEPIQRVAEVAEKKIINTRKSSPQRDSADLSQRTKSIAERLGFISFDEDEFDTPSFMRNEGEASDNA